MKVKAGDRITFRGCMWHEPSWEFSAPVIIYSPCKRNSERGSVCCEAVEDEIESTCLTLSLGDDVPTKWSSFNKKFFRFQGWSEKGFTRRRNAHYVAIEVEFYDDPEVGGLMWRQLLVKYKRAGSKKWEVRQADGSFY